MRLSKREKVLLILLLVIGGSLAYIFLFYVPCNNEINDLNSQIRSNQTIISTNMILKRQVDQLVQDISENEKKIAEFGNEIKSTFDQPPVLVYLYNTMSKYGTKLQINFNDSGTIGQINNFNMSVTMNGKYDGLRGMLKELSESDYFIKVTSMTVTTQELTENGGKKKAKKSAKAEEKTLNINMELEFYYIGEEIPPDKVYDFASGAVQYGGNIFG